MSYQQYRDYVLAKEIFEPKEEVESPEVIKVSKWNKVRSKISQFFKGKERQYESLGDKVFDATHITSKWTTQLDKPILFGPYDRENP